MATVSQPGVYNVQEFTSLGALAAGYRLYTFAQGTTTKKVAYTDSAGATPHTYTSDGGGGEYIALDARGELPYPLYLTSGAYDLCLKTAAGSTVWTRRADPTGSNLAASDGSSLVGFLQAGTGAVARTAQAKMRDVVSVKDFDAVGDGATNDSAAVQAAIDAVEAAGGGTVFFPAGTYVLNSTCTVLASGVCIEGDGHQSTWIVNGQTNAPAIKFGDGVSTYSRNGISNLVFGQKTAVTAVSGNCGLMVAKCSNFLMSNVQVFQFPAALYDGIIFDNVTQSYVENFGVQNCTNIGVKFFNDTFDIYASNGRSDSNAYGFDIRDCQGLYFSNVSAFGNTQNGFLISTNGANNTRYLFFSNCVADSSGNTNWSVVQLTVGAFTGCWASTQTSQAANPTADGWRLSGGVLSDITFSSCVTLANNRHGIFCEYAARVSINGCVMGSSYDMTAFGGKGPGNGLGSGGGSGVAVGASANRVRVAGGTFENNQRYGVEIASGADRIDIAGVECRDNIAGNVLNSANGTAHKCKISNVGGYNPVGYIVPPAVPASATEVENKTGVDCMVYITGGTVSNVQTGATGTLVGVFIATPCCVFVPAGHVIKVTYTVAPGWQWVGA